MARNTIKVLPRTKRRKRYRKSKHILRELAIEQIAKLIADECRRHKRRIPSHSTLRRKAKAHYEKNLH